MKWFEKIKALRQNRNMTQADLADYLRIDASTVTNYELGRRQPKFEVMTKIAELFNVSLDYLIRGKENIDYVSIISVLTEYLRDPDVLSSEKEQLYLEFTNIFFDSKKRYWR